MQRFPSTLGHDRLRPASGVRQCQSRWLSIKTTGHTRCVYLWRSSADSGVQGRSGEATSLAAFFMQPGSHTLLNHRQQIFAAEYARTGNATRSAITAGYSPRTAYSQGQRLLKHVEIAERLAGLVRTAEVEAKDVLREQATIAFSSMADFVGIDNDGRIEIKLRPDMPSTTMDAVAEIRQRQTKDGLETTVKLHPKLTALDQLAKHLGLYKQESGESGTVADQQADLLNQAIERLDDGELAAIQAALENPELEPLHRILVPLLMSGRVPAEAA